MIHIHPQWEVLVLLLLLQVVVSLNSKQQQPIGIPSQQQHLQSMCKPLQRPFPLQLQLLLPLQLVQQKQ
jgi:hypothetical protein